MKNYKNITAFLLVLLMLFSLASCGAGGDAEGSDKPEGSENSSEPGTSEITEEITEEVTEEESVPTALELLIRADEIAEAYTSAVQTITNKMTMSGNPVGTQVSVTKKNGNNASYTVSTDGYTSDSVVLKDGKVSYYSDIYGAYLLSDADLDDFELLINGADSEMFDYSNVEYFTNGTVAKTESGYDVTIEFSDAGKAMLAQLFGANSEEVTFGNLGLSAKINKDGSCTEQKLNMEITMSVQGMKMTLKAEADMVFSEIGGNVTIDGPMSGVQFVEFGKADDFIAILAADSKHTEVGSGEIPFEFDRDLSVTLSGASLTTALYSKFDIAGAYDPEKGMNYSVSQLGTDVSVKYYSDFTKLIVEQGGKKYADASIPIENLFYTLLTDIDGTNYGLASCSGVGSITKSGNETIYSLTLADDIAEVAASSYLANYMSYTASAVKIKSAEHTFKVNASGEYSEIGISIEATVTIDNLNYNIKIIDSTNIMSYKAATITPIVAD